MIKLTHPLPITLTHTRGRKSPKTGQPINRWVLTCASGPIIETGSSVLILKTIRRVGLTVPEVMAGPSCWEQEYQVTWAKKEAA